MALLLCVEFSDYGVVREVGSNVSGYLIGRYVLSEKIMKKCLLIILACFSSAVIAGNGPLDCDNAMNTLEINQCASMALESAEVELAKYLAASFEHNSDDVELIAAIKLAQGDWQAYMSSHCNSVYTQWRDGTIRGVMAISCKTRLTKQRAHEL